MQVSKIWIESMCRRVEGRAGIERVTRGDKKGGRDARVCVLRPVLRRSGSRGPQWRSLRCEHGRCSDGWVGANPRHRMSSTMRDQRRRVWDVRGCAYV